MYCISTHIQTHVDALRWGDCWNVDMNGLGLQCFMLRSCCHAAVVYCFSPIFVVDAECRHLQERNCALLSILRRDEHSQMQLTVW